MIYNLFISHKHSDHQIAEVVADFIATKSLGQVSVHVSSNPKYKGPRFGKNINQQLCQALSETQVLILLYTSADEDWSYCMFECGVATDPESPRTNIIVLQCGRDTPKPFEDQLRVDVRKLPDIVKFTRAFFRDPDFFPEAKQALAPAYTEQQCDLQAQELFAALAKPDILPPLDVEPPQVVAAWPMLQLQVPAASVDTVTGLVGRAKRIDECERMLLEEAVIIGCDNQSPLLFGMTSLSPNMRFAKLVSDLLPSANQPKPAWLGSFVTQVLSVSERKLNDIRWASFKESDGDRCYTPVVSSMRRLPATGKVEFDVYFFDLSNPRSIAVTQRMLELKAVYRKCLDDKTKAVKLTALRNEMANKDKERLPFLDSENRPIFMVHRSILERYLLEQQLEGRNLEDLTVAEFLDASRGEKFSAAFATVCASASVADAHEAMVGSIRDVFITEDGTRSTPVVGWLSNVDLTKAL